MLARPRASAFATASLLFGCAATSAEPDRAASTEAFVSVAVGDREACALDGLGRVTCFSADGQGRPIAGVTDAIEVAVGHDHGCARRRDGAVLCWGDNAWGQLGDGTRTARSDAVVVRGLDAATSIATGFGKSCATRADGALLCWGARETDPHEIMVDPRATEVPLAVVGVTNAVAVTLGAFHGCARTREGTVACFGANYFGQLGDDSLEGRDEGAPVHGLDRVVALAAGTHHTCALRDDRTLRCWGADLAGQLGLPAAAGGVRRVPTVVFGLHAVRTIVAGGDHACVLLEGHTAPRCWGWNDTGQVSEGAALLVRAPTIPSGVGDAIAVAAAGERTCAIASNGALRCWGHAR